MFHRVLTDWLLAPQRLAIHAPTDTAVVADVHLGYSERRQRSGDAIPLDDDGLLLDDLDAAYRSHPFARLLIAGDLFERGWDESLFEPWRQWLSTRNVDLLGVVPGNHDRPPGVSDRIPLLEAGHPLEGWAVSHEPRPGECQWIAGHWHPCVRRGNRKIPCFVVGPDWLILPAFSLDAAGVEAKSLPGCESAAVIPVDNIGAGRSTWVARPRFLRRARRRPL